MKKSTGLFAVILVQTLVVAALALASWAASSSAAGLIPGSDGVIRGCYQLTGGALRVVGDLSECSAAEAGLSWRAVTPTPVPTPTPTPTGPPDLTAPTVSVQASGSTPTGLSTLDILGRAYDEAGATVVEIALSRVGTGTIVQDWAAWSLATPWGCLLSPGERVDGGKRFKDFRCAINFPTGDTTQAGDRFVVMVRASDAAGNVSGYADPVTGSAGNTSQTCLFSPSGGPVGATTGNCVLVHDNRPPFLLQSTVQDPLGKGYGFVSASDVITLIFSEDLALRPSFCCLLGVTISDQAHVVRLTADLLRPDSPTFAYSATPTVWTIRVGVDSDVRYPAIIIAFEGFEDLAGNLAIATMGDVLLP